MAEINLSTPVTNEEIADTKRHSPVVRLTTSSPVQLTLLTLYSFPLFLIVGSMFTSRGFALESDFVMIAFRVTTQYVDSLRESFATFVIPFVTAFSSVGSARFDTPGLSPLKLFFVLVSLLAVAILALAFLNVREQTFLASLPVDPIKGAALFADGRTVLSAYIKELLTYISLLLGISAWSHK